MGQGSPAWQVIINIRIYIIYTILYYNILCSILIMGGGSSNRYIEGSDEFIASVVMPTYYIPNVKLTSADMEHLTRSWRLITDDTSAPFQSRGVSTSQFQHVSCMDWFSNAFTTRFFDVHPLSMPLFSEGLGNCIVGMLSVVLDGVTGDQAVFKKTMEDLAVRHSVRGVRLVEYGIVGDILFWCIRLCIGPDAYTLPVEAAWIKLYSKMLQVVVPAAVAAERVNETRGQQRQSLVIDIKNPNVASTPSVFEDDCPDCGDDFESKMAGRFSSTDSVSTTKLRYCAQSSGDFETNIRLRYSSTGTISANTSSN